MSEAPDDPPKDKPVRGSEEWRQERSPDEVLYDYYETASKHGITPDFNIDDASEQDRADMAGRIRAQQKSDFEAIRRNVRDQSGIDISNLDGIKHKDGKIYAKSLEVGASDVAVIKLDDYRLLTPGRQKNLRKLLTKVGKISVSKIKAEEEYMQRQFAEERKSQTHDVKEKGRHQKQQLINNLLSIEKTGKLERKQQLKQAKQDINIKGIFRASQFKLSDRDKKLVASDYGKSTDPSRKDEVFTIDMMRINQKNPRSNISYKDEGWKVGDTIDGFDTFMKKFDTVPDRVWEREETCLVQLQEMYRTAGIAISLEPGGHGIDVAKHCNDIIKTRTKGVRHQILEKARGYREAEKLEKQMDLEEEIEDLTGVFEDIKTQMKLEKKGTEKIDKKFNDIMKLTDLKSQKRQLSNLLATQKVSKPGFMAGIKSKVKLSVGVFPGLEKLREEGSEVAYQRRMGGLLNQIRSSRTSTSKRSTLTTELQATFDAAEAAGFTPQAAVTGYLKSRPEGSDVISPLSEEDESSNKLDVLKEVGSTIGSSVSEVGHGLGETLGGNTGSGMSDISGEMAGMAENVAKGGMDVEQFGKSGGPLESMSTEHQDDGPIHSSMKLKSVTLGKTTVGSGSLFEASMADSGAGVKLGDWDPYAFKQDEPRGEKFLRERGAETTGEGGPLGGDLAAGSMAFDFTAGAGPGTRKLDLGAGQFTRETHKDITTKERSPLDLGLGSSFAQRTQSEQDIVKEVSGIGIGATNPLPSYGHEVHHVKGMHVSKAIGGFGSGTAESQSRNLLNLGLKAEQRPTTGVNLLGLGNVKAPSVTRVAAKRGGGDNGSLIDQVTGGSPGLDTSHLIGNTPKKKRKLNLFGGMPR